ncbi:transglycosylase domain-containing protein [Corynebacterium flavescens]|uniref:Penicillin-binding protein n=1 Tax=Corynebacterium flavescens TaxID=28028 RepID=A0A1L7CJD3_CORFL|nr:transglycosylase domain-containing protein [Corynebacterium flavescens]APT85974.1 penicillin-binding protein [Corynebacterium flavescens]KAA8724642.1 penicillin-binding protein [Corynebacterium flavescens]GEB98359.1 penicillin-binding protein [Corynebacterium flavescens]
MTVFRSLAKIGISTLVVGILIAVACAPLAGISGVAIARTNETMQSELQDLAAGELPGVSTIKDAQGNDLAHLYSQRRYPVSPDKISDPMKQATVAIEDRRFYEHDGVDFQGNFRALWTNFAAGGVSQGASTLDQQYVKNYLLLVSARTDEEREAATEQSIPRKLREMRMATEMDAELPKDQILANYLNLVPFGNHAYGIEAAARTYFDTSAKDLTVPQAAMLAGMVQSSEYLNPYTNEEAVLDRRNTVLQAMVNNGSLSQPEADEYAQTDLGVESSPQLLSNGCIGAGDRGFFCDYVLDYLAEKGLDTEELARGGYTVKTTLDPTVQDQALTAVRNQTSPDAVGVAEVMNVIKPGDSDRDVLAMVSSRRYGLDTEQNETMLPQPNSLVGNGAGSVFKVFSAAAAIQSGYGIKSQLDVPARYEAQGLGSGGAAGCPVGRYCVENSGTYAATMTLQDALAHSPNTPFIKLIEQVGVDPVVDMAVKLGLRSYADKGSYDADTSIADHIKDLQLGSFTLGPTAVNPLELSNVGATIASDGKWCEPSPIDEVTDRNGNAVYIKETPCEQAVDKQKAHALSNALTQDAVSGTAANAARGAGFGTKVAAKTGTTESNQSSAFLGFNSGIAAAPYIYNDGTSTSPLCSGPVRQCPYGNLFGGLEPASTFFTMAAGLPAATQGTIPGYDKKYDEGTVDSLLDGLRGKSEAEARNTLQQRGYQVKTSQTIGGNVPAGRVVRAITGKDRLNNGATITLQLSDGTSPTRAPNNNNANSDNTGRSRENQEGGRPNNEERAPLISQEQIDSITNDVRSFLGL